MSQCSAWQDIYIFIFFLAVAWWWHSGQLWGHALQWSVSLHSEPVILAKEPDNVNNDLWSVGTKVSKFLLRTWHELTIAALFEFGVFLWSLTAQGNCPILAVLPGCHLNNYTTLASEEISSSAIKFLGISSWGYHLPLGAVNILHQPPKVEDVTNADHCSNDNNRQKKASPKILAKIDFIYLDDQALIRSFKIYIKTSNNYMDGLIKDFEFHLLTKINSKFYAA